MENQDQVTQKTEQNPSFWADENMRTQPIEPGIPLYKEEPVRTQPSTPFYQDDAMRTQPLEAAPVFHNEATYTPPVQPTIPIYQPSAPAQEPAAPAEPVQQPNFFQPMEEVQPQAEPPKEKKKLSLPKFNKKFLLIGIIAAIVLVVIILVLALFGGKGMDNYGLFIKEDEIFLVSKPEEILEVTTRFIDSEEDWDNEGLADIADDLADVIFFRNDGKRLFFPDRINEDDDGLTYYYRDMTKPEEEPVKIDSDIIDIFVSQDGSRVVYIKGEDGNLYIHDLEEKDKIDSQVEGMKVDDDCKRVAYLTEEGDFYIWKDGEDAVKYASEVDSLYYETNWSHFYFIKEDAFYKQAVDSEEREKICSDLSRMVRIYESGEVLYIKEDVVERNLADYVNDDMAEEDAKIEKPEKPNYPKKPAYPYSWNYDSDWEYQEAKEKYDIELAEYEATYAEMKAAYDEAYALWENKSFRDYLREELKEATQEYTEYTLYYYDGTEEVALTDALTGKWDLNTAEDNCVVRYSAYSATEVATVNISEIESSTQVSEKVEEALYSTSENYVAVGGAATLLEEEEAVSFTIAPDASAIYFLDDVGESGDGDLYRAAINLKDGTVAAPERYDSDVNKNISLNFLEDSRIVYVKNVNDDQDRGDLYIDGERLDYDVSLYGMTETDKGILYYVDWSEDSEQGTLYLKAVGAEDRTKVRDDVHDYMVMPSGDLLYLYDYSTKSYNGELFYQQLGKDDYVKVTDDVVALIKVEE